MDELLRVPTDQMPKDIHGMFNANEYPSGHLHTDGVTGETFFYALNSGGGAPIYRITGWDGWHRAAGEITLAAPAAVVAKRTGTGLKAEYFNTPDCSATPALTRTDKLIFFNWGKNTPDDSITADEFSVRWSGTYKALTNEIVRFEIRGSFPWRDKGRPQWARLWLGGKPVFDTQTRLGDFDGPFNQDNSTVGSVRLPLRAGERIALRLECGFRKGAAAIALNNDTPSLDRRAVLPEFLHPEPGPERSIELRPGSRPAVLAQFGFEEPGGVLSRSRHDSEVFGRLTGHTRRVPGKVGQAIELNARGPFAPALFPIDEELRLPDSNYTISFWFKTTAPDLHLCAATRYSSYNNRWSDHVVALAGGKVRFQLHGDQPLESSTTLNDGHWHHIVTTVAPGGQRLHVDGMLVATGRLAVRTRTSNRLGLDLGPGDGPGIVAIDEVSIQVHDDPRRTTPSADPHGSSRRSRDE